MATIITSANQKGGVGKTTTTATLAAGFKDRGFRVLAIDMDPQGNLGFCLGADYEVSATIYDVLKGECKIQHAIQRTAIVDVITSDILLSAMDIEFSGENREYLLKNALSPILDLYDYIFIDTPPNLGILTINAFTSTDKIIVPMLADIFSLQGITQLCDTINRVRERSNPKIKMLGILLTRYNSRTVFSSEIRATVEYVTKQLSVPIFENQIRNSVMISEAQAMQKSIFKYAPKNNVAKDYGNLIDELVEKGV